MTTTSQATPIDVRTLAAHERHPLILSIVHKLPAAQSMELINDHDPQALHDELQASLAGRFTWDTLENGPGTWRVLITKLGPAAGRCCGCCGG